MSLQMPRNGESIEFSLYPYRSEEATIGDIEKIIWASIKQLCASGITDNVLYDIYKITNKKNRITISKNIKLYIRHASEFYEVAKLSKPNTAPLFYYYSFLNLAKALCEIKNPNFHLQQECYRHGLSWKPNPRFLVNVHKENISVTTRGVWHMLLETVMNRKIRIANPLRLQIKELFALCLETEIEFCRTLGDKIKTIDINNIDILCNFEQREIWIKFAVCKSSLKRFNISRPKLLTFVTHSNSKYRPIISEDKDSYMFEFQKPKKITTQHKAFPFDELFEDIKFEIKALNLFSQLTESEIEYRIPIQTKLPVVLRLQLNLSDPFKGFLFYHFPLYSFSEHVLEYAYHFIDAGRFQPSVNLVCLVLLNNQRVKAS